MTTVDLGMPTPPSSPLQQRRVSRQVMVGNVPVGGGAPVSVQSMTTTRTADIDARVPIRIGVNAGFVDPRLLTKYGHASAAFEGFPVPLRIAVMGCVVNGPGEAREADLGVSAGNGKGESGEVPRCSFRSSSL